MAKVLIQDVARELGMSRNTISKALKNDPAVMESTRIRIAQMAMDMGFSKVEPALLELMRSKRQESGSKRYAILMTDFAEDDFWRGIIWGITEQFRQIKGTCMLMLTTAEEIQANRLPETMVNEKLDGVICLTIFPEAYYSLLDQRGLPIVSFDMPPVPNQVRFDVIFPEGEEAVFSITKDLIGRGCKRISFVGDIHHCQSLRDRYHGYQRAMHEADLPVEERYCLIQDEDRFYNRELLENRLNAMGELPDAFVCANDHIALDVMQYLKKRGVAIPQQVAVTGFDNKRECTIIEPHLTSVNTSSRRIGARIAQQLLWRIGNPQMHRETVIIGTSPVFRESSNV